MKIAFTKENFLSFDEFLAVLSEIEKSLSEK